MKVRCRTNIDDYEHENWPEEFCCRPMVGDAVKAESGAVLYIVTITHSVYDINKFVELEGSVMQPMLIIELHKYEAVSRR